MSTSMTSSTILSLETLQQQYNTALISYQQAYQTLISAFQKHETKDLTTYISNVETWSGILTELNNQIITLLKNEKPYLESEINERQTKNIELKKIVQQLQDEQNIVNASIDQYQSLHLGNSETNITTQQNYMKYILYIIILIVILVIFFKIVLSPKSGTQRGGGSSSTKLNDILFLLSLMIVFLCFGLFFKEHAGFIIVILIVLIYFLIKMKVIPNFLRI